jgi:hypothetical protein
MGWMNLGLNVAKTGLGLLGGLLGGGKSEEEKLAEQNQRAQINRSNQFWQQAQGQQNAASNYFAPIAGGSRTAAMEAVAPEVQGATQRMDAGRRSLLNLSSRSGGAAAQVDPYAKAAVATNILEKVRPMAAQSMADLAKTSGGWAGQQGQAVENMLEQEKWRKEQAAKRGAGMFDVINKGIGNFGDWWGSRTPRSSAGASPTGVSGMYNVR